MTAVLHRELAVLSTWLFVMLLLGVIFGAISAFLITALIVYMVWSLYNLNKLSKWLAKPSKQAPESLGSWPSHQNDFLEGRAPEPRLGWPEMCIIS